MLKLIWFLFPLQDPMDKTSGPGYDWESRVPESKGQHREETLDLCIEVYFCLWLCIYRVKWGLEKRS